jgi:peptidoglycan/xylan/chitin deacetylase (PgdA/CDA1 family)
MIIRILQNKYIGAREKYVIEFMLDSLGYFYSWISDDNEVAQREILLYCNPPDDIRKPSSEYSLCLPKIIDLEKILPENISWQEKEINGTVVPLIGTLDKKQTADAPLPNTLYFDITANIYYHLARIEESGIQHPDQIDDNVENAVLYKYGRFKRPVIDILLNYFDEILKKMLLSLNPFYIKKCAYPQGEDFGVALTHDVDIIRAYHPLKKAALSFLYYLKLSKSPSPQEMTSADNNIWGFEVIFDFYRKTGWKGVFFFIARYREDRHFRYRLKNRKIAAVIKRIKKEGHEIAWHPSRYAFEHSKRYKNELTRLKNITGEAIKGMRHHYLRCLYPQIWHTAEELGLSYDASLAYRRIGGFRAGTCRPFGTFNHKQNKALNLWEFPTTLFEASIQNDTAQISTIIETVKQFNGLLTIIWHTNNFHTDNELYTVWLEIINTLQKHNIFITTLHEHLKWQKQRKNIKIENIETKNESVKISLNCAEKINAFSIETVTPGQKVKVKSSEIQLIEQFDDKIIISGNEPFDKIELDFRIE